MQHAVVEEERDRSLGVDVGRLEDEIAHVDIRIELLAHLAPERVGMTLGRVDLASRKLPQTGQMDAVRAPRDEKLVVLLDDGGDNDDGHVNIRPSRYIPRV